MLQDQVQRGQLLLGRGHPEEEAGGGVDRVARADTQHPHIYLYSVVSYVLYI